jgi:hypothetical protein
MPPIVFGVAARHIAAGVVVSASTGGHCFHHREAGGTVYLGGVGAWPVPTHCSRSAVLERLEVALSFDLGDRRAELGADDVGPSPVDSAPHS